MRVYAYDLKRGDCILIRGERAVVVKYDPMAWSVGRITYTSRTFPSGAAIDASDYDVFETWAEDR
jgi:hypothetical protein